MNYVKEYPDMLIENKEYLLTVHSKEEDAYYLKSIKEKTNKSQKKLTKINNPSNSQLNPLSPKKITHSNMSKLFLINMLNMIKRTIPVPFLCLPLYIPLSKQKP